MAAIENFKMGDILVLFSSSTESFSYTVDGCPASPEDQINSFISSTADDLSFQVKKHNGERTGQTQRDLRGSDPEKKIFILDAGLNGITYDSSAGTSDFLQVCWTDAGHSSEGGAPLDNGWAGSIAGALTSAAGKFSDLDKRAEKELQSGSTSRTAGRLIFACEPFAKEAMRRLYGLTKTKTFYYNLESSIGIKVPIVTSAKGRKSFCVTYKDRGTAANNGATKTDRVKALIYVEDGIVSGGTCLDVRIENTITESELAALNVQFANAAGIPATSSAWINQVDNFVNKMDAYRQGTGSFPSSGLSHSENIPGGGLFAVKIVSTTSAGAGAVFAVRAAFSIGTDANGSLTVKFENFTLEFSPNAFFQEREMIKQLRARYREAMNNYYAALEAYRNGITSPGGPVVPSLHPGPDSTPPETITDLLPPPDAIIVPPNGQAPSRESIPENAASPGNLDVTPPAPVGETQFGNTGSNARLTDGTVQDAISTED